MRLALALILAASNLSRLWAQEIATTARRLAWGAPAMSVGVAQ